MQIRRERFSLSQGWVQVGMYTCEVKAPFWRVCSCPGLGTLLHGRLFLAAGRSPGPFSLCYYFT